MTRPDILILGQGLAGTLLAWQLERAGFSFAIVDRGHADVATMAAAGIINPITGRRLAKSWLYETFWPVARAAYQEIEAMLGVRLWHPMRVRRLFADERERAIAADRMARGEVAAYVESTDAAGWWVRHAARVDLPRLLERSRARWERQGRLRVGDAPAAGAAGDHRSIIDCRGVEGTEAPEFRFVPWEYSKGEVLALAVDALDPGVILNRRQWIVPTEPGRALTGSTHEPGVRDCRATSRGREVLANGARGLIGSERAFDVTGHRAGVRVTVPDRRPVIGVHSEQPHRGLVNGLGAKGALWAPWLALQWLDHLQSGANFEPAVDVRRFCS